MKAYRRTKQLRRRRPNRTGARAPSPEYHIGDRHKRSQWAKMDIMTDYSLRVQYNRRGPRIMARYDPMGMYECLDGISSGVRRHPFNKQSHL